MCTFAGKPSSDASYVYDAYDYSSDGSTSSMYDEGDYSSDDYLNENERVVHTVPEFTSHEFEGIVNEGDTIKLPCFVDKLGMIQNLRLL